jgi:RNA polymerase sporulation-specific sigma factor
MLSATFAIFLMSPFLMLRMSEGAGSFPKPLSAADEQKYIELFIHGDMEARNILIERNLRLVAHIINN